MNRRPRRQPFTQPAASTGWYYSLALDGPAEGCVFETKPAEERLWLICPDETLHVYRFAAFADQRIRVYTHYCPDRGDGGCGG